MVCWNLVVLLIGGYWWKFVIFVVKMFVVKLGMVCCGLLIVMMIGFILGVLLVSRLVRWWKGLEFGSVVLCV